MSTRDWVGEAMAGTNGNIHGDTENGREDISDHNDGGLDSHNSLNSQCTEPEWPTLDEAALYGVLGDAVRLTEPHTEADPVALLGSLLTGIGTIIGRRPHVIAGHVHHHTNLFVVPVGETSKARKGTSWAASRGYLDDVDHDFMRSRVLGGFGSGEAFVDEVRDAQPDDDDPGAPDKRLLVHESEFSKVLTVCGRDNSTLSANLRQAWDGTRIENRTRGRKVVTATGHSVSILGHITAEELRRVLTTSDAMNGFGNRILWLCTKRSKLLPFDGVPDPSEVQAVVAKICTAVRFAHEVDRVQFTAAGRAKWEHLYHEMDKDDPGGMLGALVARCEPQVLRVALNHALLDCCKLIDEPHLDAAYALWRYSRASAEWIWGDAIGDEVADTLLRALRRAGDEGLDFREQSNLFSRHVNAKRLDAARKVLEERGLIETTSEQTDGRARNVTRIAKKAN